MFMAGTGFGGRGCSQGTGSGSAGCNPRKFSEKIALHTQRQAEDTAAFQEVMMDITSTKVTLSVDVGLTGRDRSESGSHNSCNVRREGGLCGITV